MRIASSIPCYLVNNTANISFVILFPKSVKVIPILLFSFALLSFVFYFIINLLNPNKAGLFEGSFFWGARSV